MILSTIVLFILKLMELAPFYIKVTHSNTPMPIKDKLLEFHSSHCAFFYNIFLLFGSVIAFSLVVIYFSTFLIYYESELDSLSKIVMNVLTFLTVCSIWLTVIIKQKVIVDIANDLATVDINLSLLSLDSVARGNQTNSFILFLLLVILWSTTFIIQTIHWTWGIMDTVVKVLMVPISFQDFSRESQMIVRLPYDESKFIYFIALRRTYTLLYQCGQKINDTGKMTQELLTYYINDHKLIPELRILAIELIERKINFMAYGFFDLDCSLILSVLDVTLTDLIVILQFNMKKNQTKQEDYVE